MTPRRRLLCRLAAVIALTAWVHHAAAAGAIRTDGSVGPAGTIAGPTYVIPQSLGALSGANLFHSFSIFNVGAGERAFFTTTTPTIANVISRVTGGTPSQINGLIALLPAAGAPNFFFINPAGVVFGSGAQVSVPGAFYVSTAQYLKFPDGNFYADTTRTSTFSSAPPEAFGFLGTTRAPVVLNGGANIGTPNRPFQIVAGDVGVDGAVLFNNAGDVRVVAAGGGAGEIGFSGVTTTAAGTVSVSNGGAILTAAAGQTPAGNITVEAGSIGIGGGGQIFSGMFSGATARTGNIDVFAAQNLLIASRGQIGTSTSSVGIAGSVNVLAGSLTIDGAGLPSFAGIYSLTSASGNAGAVNVGVAGEALLTGGGGILSNTFGPGNGGAVTVSASKLTVDGQGAFRTLISSDASEGSTGNAGTVQIQVAGLASILNGGQVSSRTDARGNAGTVSIFAESLNIDGQGSPFATGLNTQAGLGSTGNAGSVTVVTTGHASLLGGGVVSSATQGSGNGGSISIFSGSLSIDGQNGKGLTGISNEAFAEATGKGGSTQVAVMGHASIVNGGVINSNTFGTGDAGSVTVAAKTLTIDRQGSPFFTGISSDALPGSRGNAGPVQVQATELATIVNGGQISSSATASGNAGTVKFSASSLVIDGQGATGSTTGIISHAFQGSTGDAGQVQVAVSGTASVLNAGNISSVTFGAGSGGAVTVSAGKLTLDGQGLPIFTGISSSAEPNSSGSAGAVQVSVAGELSIRNTAAISSSTAGSGNAGTVSLAAGSLMIDGQGAASATGISTGAATGSTGNAGAVQVAVAGQATIIDKGEISSNTSGSGNGGSVQVAVAGQAILSRGGVISSSTDTAGNAGSVSVSAANLTVDGQGMDTGFASQAGPGSRGNAGSVQVTVAGQATFSHKGLVSSTTFGAGNAGSVMVSAANLTIDGQGVIAGLSSEAGAGSSGNAGLVQVAVKEHALLLNAGVITSSTLALGNAGSVTVSARNLTVDGASSSIKATAEAGSSGQTGNVTVSALDSIALKNGGRISIQNDASAANPAAVVPTQLSVSAPTISLTNASITAASTGNVAASNIKIDYGNLMSLDPSFITTSANTGNGGAIVIKGGGPLVLENSLISTSVTGPVNGNGGDITITAPVLVLNNGFIQANTAAAQATGGNVNINVDAIVASGGQLNVGGNTPFVFNPNAVDFNVIQAAAPTGLSGNVEVTAPPLNIAGSLVGLRSSLLSASLGKALCSRTGGSSLAQTGRGGMPKSSSDLLSVSSDVIDLSDSSSRPPRVGMQSAPLLLLAGCL